MKVTKSLLLGLALLLATSAFAANQGSLQVHEPLNVAGQQLTAGDYKVTWQGTGPSVELNILQGNTIVATVPARLVDLTRSSASDAAVTKMNVDGSRSLSEIRFRGRKYAIAIGEESARADSSK